MATLAELSKQYDLSMIRDGGFRGLLRLAHDEGLLIEALEDVGIDPRSLTEPRSRLRCATDRVLARLRIAFRREIRLVSPQ